MEDFFSFFTTESCDVGEDLGVNALGIADDLEVDSVECLPLDFGFKRQATGVIVVRFVVRKTLNATCGKVCFAETSRENKRNIVSAVTSPEFKLDIQVDNITIETNFTATTTEKVIHEKTHRVCSPDNTRLINGICSKFCSL